MPEGLLLREVTTVRQDAAGVIASVRALRCVSLPGMPGHLTGEPLADQGIETGMPNLPDLELPALEESEYELRIRWAAPEIARITVAPVGARALAEPGDWLGIVTTDPCAPTSTTVEETPEAVTVTSDHLRIRLHRRPFALTISDTRRTLLRTAERLRQVAGFPMAPAVLADNDRITLHLQLDEDVLGFGEQFSRVVKNGQRLPLRVEDALGTGTGMAYKPAPVWHSSTGYTGLLNTGATVTADVGHTHPSVLGLSVADEAIDLYVLAGESPKQRLSSYTALTGSAPVPPLWAFGYWLGRCRYHSRGEMEAVGNRLRAERVPCDVLHLDPDWLVVDRLNCDFCWNTERFGDRAELVAALARLGIRLSLWEVPYLDPVSPRYAEAQQRGYLVHNNEGGTASAAGTPTPDGRPRALVDFTNPAARRWWQSFHEEFLDDGVAVFKTDFGEGFPDGAELADGTPPAHAHNLYPLRYNAVVSEVIGRHTGRNPLVWARSGWAGTQRYPAQWGGDAESTVAGMRATLRGGLSHALSSPGFWGHDIGGFFGPELTPGLYIRWTQLGALSPLMRAHGLHPREPWVFGGKVLDAARDWIRLRYSLLPYLWQVAHEAAGGWPMLRPLAVEFGEDECARLREDTYMLGGDLLVVPVFDDGDAPVTRTFYVPAGTWTDLRTEATYSGPALYTAEIPLEHMPVLVRHGSVLPRVEVDDARNTDDLRHRPWILHAYGETAQEHRFRDFDGTSLVVHLDGAEVRCDPADRVTHLVRHGRTTS